LVFLIHTELRRTVKHTSLFVQVYLRSPLHVDKTVSSEHSQFIKTDYLLVRASIEKLPEQL